MVATVQSIAFQGLETKFIEVQVQISPGLPSISIVGLGDKAVAESKERIRAAFHSLSLSFPQRKLTINLAPADINKEGSHFDLSIALGILCEMNVIRQQDVEAFVALGELSLDGRINAVSGVLPAAIASNSIDKGIICPIGNVDEAVWSGNKSIIAPANLMEIINHLNGTQVLEQPKSFNIQPDNENYLDLKDIKGQLIPKRALEIAAAGGHNLLMIGPPGSGKSMLAKRLSGILPPLSHEEMLEVSIIASIAGTFKDSGLITKRPYRDPHSSSSMAAMVGGGKNAKPGEITLAHLGVLFLDELPEYANNVLDSLRQPIEDGTVSIARVNNHITYPANFQFIAAMNPCKCGHFGDIMNACSKSPRCAEDYQSKISGPLFDRFDMMVDVPAQDIFSLDSAESGEASSSVAERVESARKIQSERYREQRFYLNSEADGEVLEKYTKLSAEALDILKRAVPKFGITMRGYNRILRVARTIADLANSEEIMHHHIAEALNFRITKLKA